MSLSARKLIVCCAVIAVVAATTIVFYKTQSFYMLYARGQALIVQKKFIEARRYLLEALALAPHDVRTLQYILTVDEKLGSDIGSRQAYRIIKNARANDLTFSLYVADKYYSDAYYKQAEMVYEDILSEHERFFVKKRLAEVLLWQKKYDESIVLLEALFTRNPKNIQVGVLLANAYFWSQKHDQAIEQYKKLIAMGFKSEEVILNLAEALRYAGRNEEAVEVYDTILEKK